MFSYLIPMLKLLAKEWEEKYARTKLSDKRSIGELVERWFYLTKPLEQQSKGLY